MKNGLAKRTNGEPLELRLIIEAKHALERVRTIDEAKDIRDKAEAIRAYLRQAGESLEVQNAAAEVKIRAERKGGELLKAMEKNRGTAGNGRPRKLGGCKVQPPNPAETLEDIGIEKTAAHRWQTVAAMPVDAFEEHVETAKQGGRELTSAGVLKAAKQWQAQHPDELPIIDVPIDTDFAGKCVGDLQTLIDAGLKFPTIYADPPWAYGNQATRAATGNHYATMSVEDICAEPVAELSADDAHLHLWTTNAFLFEAKRVIEAWGFEYKSCFLWCKPQMGIGNYWRVSHEFLLLGVRGDARFRDRGQMSWAAIDRTKHSRKPREVRERVEAVSPGPYLEIYGRETMPAPWTVYGNQMEASLFHA